MMCTASNTIYKASHCLHFFVYPLCKQLQLSPKKIMSCCNDTECVHVESDADSDEAVCDAEIETVTPEAHSEITPNTSVHITNLQAFCLRMQSRVDSFVVYQQQQIICCTSNSFAASMHISTYFDEHSFTQLNNRFAGAIWATGCFWLVDCWIRCSPTMFSLAAVGMCTTAMFLLNSIDYRLFTSISANTRLQAIRLLSLCYVVFFSTIASSSFESPFTEDSISSFNCVNSEQFYMFSVIVASSLLRFGSQMYTAQSTQSYNSYHSTPITVLLSVCAALLLVIGVCMHFKVYCSSNGIQWAPLPYVVSVPFLLCVRQSALIHNTQTWTNWNSFLPSSVYCFSLSWPYCLSRNKMFTHTEALEATTASFFLILSVQAFTIMMNSTQERTSTSSNSLYMLV